MQQPAYDPTAPVLYLDYDGAVHHENVRVGLHGHFELQAPVDYVLFQHVTLLEELLAPYPEVQIILSTAWLARRPLRKVAKELTLGLRARVVGSIVPPDMPVDFWRMPKGLQVAEDVERRRPVAWFAIDDDQVGWPDWARPHVVFSHPYEGICTPDVLDAIRMQLAAVVSKTRSQS